ncbi:O-methyltransferase [Natrinema gelatinilyticum]|uniref:O-methyltransferase n=1 Tax=Natrinema gelatinilyticum TaxID=2961571 RepID=UPI0020C264FB|nr:O-methyltransferase [Natrinema gelatinilyticum]
MAELHSDAVGQLIEWAGTESDEVLNDMELRAEEEEFPTVGAEVGRTFALCTRLLGAQSVLELGSGYGYSAYWIAQTLPDDGTIVLTERDSELLGDARTYFERGNLSERAVFKHGDALEIAENCTDSFDLVVLDHDTADYIPGFDIARGLVDPGGAILIDNVAIYEEILTPEELLATLNGETPPNERTRTVAEFFNHLKNDTAFETYILPVGEGLAISYRTQ